jgi:hypothetical protein
MPEPACLILHAAMVFSYAPLERNYDGSVQLMM